MNQISILGCGWLGLPLAVKLTQIGYQVKGSTTSGDKIPILSNSGIMAYQIRLGESDPADIAAFLSNSSILIIAVPPKAASESAHPLPANIRQLVPQIEASFVRQVLFISSISVYADSNSIVTEASSPQPQTASGRQLLEAESTLMRNNKFKTTIIRFGGLIGADRHPVHYLSGKSDIKNPEARVNLIHQNDCIGIVLAIIRQQAWGYVFNGVHPNHPTRNIYYSAKALELGLALPEFGEEGDSTGKTVDSENLNTILNYRFTTEI